jgi:hypothetical protein
MPFCGVHAPAAFRAAVEDALPHSKIFSPVIASFPKFSSPERYSRDPYGFKIMAILLGVGSEELVDIGKFLGPTKRALAPRVAYRCRSTLVDSANRQSADTPPGNRKIMDFKRDWFEHF